MTNRIFSALATLFLSVNMTAQSSMALHQDDDGRYMLDASVNGVDVKTYYTEESWFASLSSTTYLFLYENGYIVDADVRGMSTVTMPGGKNTKAGALVIRNLKIGNVIVKDIPAFVIAKQKVPLVVGASAFDRFGEVSIENGMLVIYDTDEAVTASAIAQAPEDSLKLDLQKLIDAKRYDDACATMEKLKYLEPLSQYDSYQYIMLLNMLGRSDDTLAEARKWLSANAGHSATLDYWVYDAMGDSFSRKDESTSAIESYERAINTYYDIFQTSENAVRRSPAKDETLGVTLFKLSRQYASVGNHKKARASCALAAKCGNLQAREFCDRFKVRY